MAASSNDVVTSKSSPSLTSKTPHVKVGVDVNSTAAQQYGETIAQRYRGTAADEHEMKILGKKQVLRRNFSFLSMLGFASTCVASWEAVLTYLTFVLTDGGTALLFWGFIACAIGQALVYASLAELASMSPTAGGQYHWVSEFAPPKYQKILSYLSGWLTAIGWQVGGGGVCFLIGTLIQGLIALNDETYVSRNWHGTLLAIAAVLFCIAFNTFLASYLPLLDKFILIFHFSGFLAIVASLWATAEHGKPEVVLFQFINNGGWPTTGLSSMIGLLAPMAVLIGYDCSVHMSEEIKDASITLPRVLMGSVIINASLAFIMSVTLIFCLGDIESVLSTTTGYPFIQCIFNATRSYVWTSILVAIVILLLTVCAINEIAAASRQVWSFARDKGLPSHSWLARVSNRSNLPLPAVVVSLCITALLALINVGSTVALNAIVSLGAVATLVSYWITIFCIVTRRLSDRPLPPRRWSLGKFGLPINVAALMFLIPLTFFLMWPQATPVTASTLNWSPVMLVAVLLVAMIYYVVKGKNEYVGPVVYVERDYEM